MWDAPLALGDVVDSAGYVHFIRRIVLLVASVSSCSCVVASVVPMILHYPQDISIAQFLHKDSYPFTS